ncbi:hypothetical protein [Nocardia asiatica]|uniref:hypothetical protein n=1 Tax=Nocardia asiatica TaxID=209252 RepID=UPI003EDF7D46
MSVRHPGTRRLSSTELSGCEAVGRYSSDLGENHRLLRRAVAADRLRPARYDVVDDDVDATRQGVFLFNFLYGQEEKELVPVWEYTAGWWAINRGLDNSRVMQPLPGEPRDCGIINHCRWDRLRDVAPKMIFRPSFRRFVLADFAANDISAHPALYRPA